MGIFLLIPGCAKTPSHPPEILFITKDQSDTLSLNPSRLEVAAAMALESFGSEDEKETRLQHRFIRYTGEEAQGYGQAKAYLESNHAVVALVGDFNSAGTAYVAKLAKDFEIPHLSFMATEEEIFQHNPWSFSYRSLVAHETQALLTLVTDRLESKAVIGVYNDLSNIQDRWKAVESLLPEQGVTVSWSKEVSRDQRDFRPFFQSLASKDMESHTLMLFLSSGQLEHFLQQASMAEISQAILVSPVTLAPEIVSELPELNMPIYSLVQGFYFGLQEGEKEELAAFAEAYRINFGQHRMDGLAPWIYDGVKLLHELVEQGLVAKELRESLEAYHEMRMMGTLCFDQVGRIQENPFVEVTIHKGQLKELGK